MKASCLINNYNYAHFIAEAIESALNQTYPFYEIVIVDDGSIDESVQLVKKYQERYPQIKLLEQANSGQLSCFNQGFLKSSGDIICFLDADDKLEPNYLETILKFYNENPDCDFLFCAYKLFGEEQYEKEVYSYSSQRSSFGKTRLLSLTSSYPWIGGPTSTLSARKDLLSKIFPFPNEYLADWLTKADDCLIYAASAFGGTKYYLCKPLVLYRRHCFNDSSTKEKIRKNKEYRSLQGARTKRFFSWLINKSLKEQILADICALHLEDKFANYSLSSVQHFYSNKIKKLFFLPHLLFLIWEESLGRPLVNRLARQLIVFFAFLFNVRGSFAKFI